MPQSGEHPADRLDRQPKVVGDIRTCHGDLNVASAVGARLDNHHCVQAAGPMTIEQNPKGSVQPRQPDAGSLFTSKNLDLVAKNGHLKLQVDASSEAGKEAAEDGNGHDLAHDLDATGHGPE